MITMLKTYLITEACKAAETIPTWLGWTIAGVLTVATIAMIGAIAYMIWDSRR
jgi:hypothetical protein